MMLADRADDADWIRALAARTGALANIPPCHPRLTCGANDVNARQTAGHDGGEAGEQPGGATLIVVLVPIRVDHVGALVGHGIADALGDRRPFQLELVL